MSDDINHELPPLPEPDTHCVDDDTGKDVWSYSPGLARAYARAALAALPAEGAEPVAIPIDYLKLIADCFRTTGARQGEKRCIAFARGAEWYREQVLAATPSSDAQDAALPPLPERLCIDDDRAWFSEDQMRAYARAANSLSDAQDAAPQVLPERVLLGQAQHLIGDLIAHGLIPKTIGTDQYTKLWEIVTEQIRCVNREGAALAIDAAMSKGGGA